MNKIYLLDNINLNVLKTQKSITVRLKKKYNITLLNIFPTVLESIIREYIDDIIEVGIKYQIVFDIEGHWADNINIIIKDQYICYKKISTSFNMSISEGNKIMYGICCDYIDRNILEIIDDSTYDNNNECIFVWHSIFNMYMNCIYNTNKYFSKQCYYFGDIHYENGLWMYEDQHEFIKIRIHDHKLFKNIIVIMQCIINGILKN